MIFELTLGIGLTIVLIAFFAEYIDSTLGMGYGTTLTPLLLIMGFEPLQVIPAILLSELVTGLLAGFTHHSFGNMYIKPKTMNIFKIFRAIKKLGIKKSFHLGIPLHLKVIMLISLCSIIGTISAVFLAISLPKFYLKMYIGILILVIGLVILFTIGRKFKFSWKKITFLGLIASFNKGMSGGGYGPVVTGGQLLSGVDGKNAVGITSMAEGLTCIVGVIAYLFTNVTIDWTLAPYLMIGAILSVPFSVISVKKIKTKYMRLIIGLVTCALGLWTIIKLF